MRALNQNRNRKSFVAAFFIATVIFPFTASSQSSRDPQKVNPISISVHDQWHSAKINDVSLAGYSLSQNYPNPVNPASAINYEIPSASHVSLDIVDAVGIKIMSLVNTNQAAGKYTVAFSTTHGRTSLSSGLYFYRLTAGKFISTKKLILLQ